ncbi:MAG: hypothetical protein M1820_001836 [Bogoriella megaspora]|nr:MAG: hypothetical protein M1820_001836 [Bogoriella megaspora]
MAFAVEDIIDRITRYLDFEGYFPSQQSPEINSMDDLIAAIGGPFENIDLLPKTTTGDLQSILEGDSEKYREGDTEKYLEDELEELMDESWKTTLEEDPELMRAVDETLDSRLLDANVDYEEIEACQNVLEKVEKLHWALEKKGKESKQIKEKKSRRSRPDFKVAIVGDTFFPDGTPAELERQYIAIDTEWSHFQEILQESTKATRWNEEKGMTFMSSGLTLKDGDWYYLICSKHEIKMISTSGHEGWSKLKDGEHYKELLKLMHTKHNNNDKDYVLFRHEKTAARRQAVRLRGPTAAIIDDFEHDPLKEIFGEDYLKDGPIFNGPIDSFPELHADYDDSWSQPSYEEYLEMQDEDPEVYNKSQQLDGMSMSEERDLSEGTMGIEEEKFRFMRLLRENDGAEGESSKEDSGDEDPEHVIPRRLASTTVESTWNNNRDMP